MNFLLFQHLDPTVIRPEFKGAPLSQVASMSSDSLLPMWQEVGDVDPLRMAPCTFSYTHAHGSLSVTGSRVQTTH